MCGSYVEVRTFSGEIVLQAAPTQATTVDGPCVSQRIIAQNLGESEAFTVDPADAVRLRILSATDTVTLSEFEVSALPQP